MAEVSPVRSVSISTDGRRVAWGHTDGAVRQWAVGSDHLGGTWAAEGFRISGMTVKQVLYSPDGLDLALVSDRSSTVALCDCVRGLCRRHYTFKTHSDVVQGVSFLRKLPTGDCSLHVVTGETSLRLWNAEQNTCIQSFLGHERQVLSAQLSADRRRFFSGSYDGTVREWDVLTGKTIRVHEGHNDGAFGISVAGDDKRIAVCTGDGSVAIWDSQSGKRIARSRLHSGGPAYCVLFDAEGLWIASGGRDGSIRLSDSTRGLRRRGELKGHLASVFALDWSLDRRLLASGSRDGTVRLWGMGEGDSDVTVLDVTGDVNAPVKDIHLVDIDKTKVFRPTSLPQHVTGNAADGVEVNAEAAVPGRVHTGSISSPVLPGINVEDLMWTRDLAIGTGSYGTVYRGLLESEAVAIKVIRSNLPKMSPEAAAQLTALRHPNLVQVLGVFDGVQLGGKKDEKLLVTEFMDGGSLAQALKALETTPFSVRISIAGQISRGLAHLHSKELAHGSLSARNILLDDPITEWTARSRVKLIDAGLRFILQTASSTISYCAPECFEQSTPLEGNAALQADVFALGIQLWEIFSTKRAWEGTADTTIIDQIRENDARPYPLPDNVPLVLQNLMVACWQSDPNRRPTAQEVLTCISLIPTAPPPMPP